MNLQICIYPYTSMFTRICMHTHAHTHTHTHSQKTYLTFFFWFRIPTKKTNRLRYVRGRRHDLGGGWGQSIYSYLFIALNTRSRFVNIGLFWHLCRACVLAHVNTTREVGGWGRDPFSRNWMSPTPRRKWYFTTGRRAHSMVLDPIPQSLPVHFFGSRPQPPTSPRR